MSVAKQTVSRLEHSRVLEYEDVVFAAARDALLGWSEQLVGAGLRAQLNPIARADTDLCGTPGYWSEVSIWFFAVSGPVESFVDIVEFLAVAGKERLCVPEVKQLVDEEVMAVIEAYKQRSKAA